MNDRIRVAIVDDHPLFREGVAATLRSAPDIEVVSEGATVQDAVRICRTVTPDIVLLDVSMGGSGIKATLEMRSVCPAVRTVMLTASESEHDVGAALGAGVDGYILKGCSGSELISIVRGVWNNLAYVTLSLAARLLARNRQPIATPAKQPDLSDLTYREEQIVQLLSLGQTNKEIASTLKLTEKTVKHYLTKVLHKLQVRNRVEAVLIAGKSATAIGSALPVASDGSLHPAVSGGIVRRYPSATTPCFSLVPTPTDHLTKVCNLARRSEVRKQQ